MKLTMPQSQQKPQERRDQFSKIISNMTVVVVDTVAGSRSRILKALLELGAKKSSIGIAGNYEHGIAEIKRLKPKLIISDYTLDNKRPGLDLLNIQRSIYPEHRDCIFLLLTANNSQSAIAQAAEEDVDDFILKPYTHESLMTSIVEASLRKIHPSDYMKKIEAGKAALVNGDLKKAMENFDLAKALNPKPSLALFYRGQVEVVQKSLDQAGDDFKKGLGHSKIHHKCMIGLHESLLKQNRIDDAYAVLKRLTQYYPANSTRLQAVLRMAVKTLNFDDVYDYHPVYKALGDQSDIMIRHLCSALVVAAKYHLMKKNKARALQHFNKVVESCQGRASYLRFSVEVLTEFKMYPEAERVLAQFPATARYGQDYQTLEVLVRNRA